MPHPGKAERMPQVITIAIARCLGFGLQDFTKIFIRVIHDEVQLPAIRMDCAARSHADREREIRRMFRQFGR